MQTRVQMSADSSVPQGTRPRGRARAVQSAATPAHPDVLPQLDPLVGLLARLVAADLLAEGAESATS
jgi:hypothetical protein